jgi:hypothetical protein
MNISQLCKSWKIKFKYNECTRFCHINNALELWNYLQYFEQQIEKTNILEVIHNIAHQRYKKSYKSK